MTDEARAKKIAADMLATWLNPEALRTVSVEELLRRAALAGLRENEK